LITAVDTNVLIDVFGANPACGEKSADAERRCLQDGALVACAVVWAQTAVAFPSREKFARAIRGQ